jgi:hypothetical protein
MSDDLNDPEYWKRCAQEARDLACELDDAGAKQTLLEIATSYEKLAELAETKQVSKP